MRKIYIVLLIFIVLGISAFAQKKNIEGTVKSTSGESLPGATVLIKGTTNGTVTDVNGHFLVSAQSNDILVVSFIGYKSEEITVGNQSIVSITLTESGKELEGIVVTALGIEKQKSTIGYAIGDVKGSELVKAREPNAINALTGKVAGLVVGSIIAKTKCAVKVKRNVNYFTRTLQF